MGVSVTNLANLLLLLPLNLASSPAEKSMDPGLQEEFCRNFTVGNTENHMFFSPSYPQNYPAGIKCFRCSHSPISANVRLIEIYPVATANINLFVSRLKGNN